MGHVAGESHILPPKKATGLSPLFGPWKNVGQMATHWFLKHAGASSKATRQITTPPDIRRDSLRAASRRRGQK